MLALLSPSVPYWEILINVIVIRLLMGFISRQEAEDFLHKSENGTFLIRFSDSELGGVTVAWITVNETGTV